MCFPENILNDSSSSQETKSWGYLLVACLDQEARGSKPCGKADLAKKETVVDESLKSDEQTEYSDDNDFENAQMVYKLQILYATDLVGDQRRKVPNPLCIVLCNGAEIARSAVTPHSTNPIFRTASENKNLGFCVEVSRWMAFSATAQARTSEYVIQVYSYATVAQSEFLGEVRLAPADLRDAIGQRLAKALKPMIVGTHGLAENKFVGGKLHFVGHLLPAEPRFALHVVAASDLAHPSAGQLIQVHDTAQQGGLVRRLGARAIKGIKESLKPSLNPFAICYARFAVFWCYQRELTNCVCATVERQ